VGETDSRVPACQARTHVESVKDCKALDSQSWPIVGTETISLLRDSNLGISSLVRMHMGLPRKTRRG